MGLLRSMRQRALTKQYGEGNFSPLEYRSQDGKIMPLWFITGNESLNFHGTTSNLGAGYNIKTFESFVNDVEGQRPGEWVIELIVSPAMANTLFAHDELTSQQLLTGIDEGMTLRITDYFRSVRVVDGTEYVSYIDLIIDYRLQGSKIRYTIETENIPVARPRPVRTSA